MQILAIVALICFLAIQSVSAQNPQQQVCARPPKGCNTQMKYQSCVNWHGCKWIGGSVKVGDFCRDDKDCKDKPTLVPTMPPAPPTEMPTPKPTTPTTPPVDPCVQPPKGCKSLKGQNTCMTFTACEWKNKCVVKAECK